MKRSLTLLLLAVGAGAGGALMYGLIRPAAPEAGREGMDHNIATVSPPGPPAAAAPAPPHAGPPATASIEAPGLVVPNGYRSVAVTAVASGRVTRVMARLGDRVSTGQPLAEIFSPELADAETEYLSQRAELESADQEMRRTERLAEIGSASRQELERVRAERMRRATSTASARARLVLLGLSQKAIAGLSDAGSVSAVVTVTAPRVGTITARTLSEGLNVAAGAELFTVVDLSTVWVIADIYERDLARVRVGQPVTIAFQALPGRAIEGRISYIDPELAPDSRTAKARIEIPNAGGVLRLGMFSTVTIDGAD